MVKLGKAYTFALEGFSGTKILIEATILVGLPNFTIVGLPDTSVSEAKERLRASFHNSGLKFPDSRITVNLSPADRTKTGSSFDLGIAAALLAAQTERSLPKDLIVVGELGLDGSVRGVTGVLPTVIAAREHGVKRVIVPAENYHEAKLIPEIEIIPLSHLSQLAVKVGISQEVAQPLKIPIINLENHPSCQLELADVHGQNEAVYGLIIAAIGGHHLQMIGAPGIGKSMLAQRMQTFLPPLESNTAIELAAIQSLNGALLHELPQKRPYVAPHHTISTAALIGGGAGIARPGAISQAHGGVLYCDEFPEFTNSAVQALRQPLENGFVEIHRSRSRVRYPASFQLLAAANPCPCGYLLDGKGLCKCSAAAKLRYQLALKGPVFDRIDIRIIMHRPTKAELLQKPVYSSAAAQELVEQAWNRSQIRNKKIMKLESMQKNSLITNSRLSGRWLRENTPLTQSQQNDFEKMLGRGQISMRGIDRTLRIAWSIADFNTHDKPNSDDIFQAFLLRNSSPQES